MNNDVTMGANLFSGGNVNRPREPLSMNNAVTMRPDVGASLDRIDQYELIRELGGGGFGCVYLARDTVAGIEVAVKGLPPLVRLNKEELENVRKNFALVSRLHHPNIAAALHLQKVEKAFYDDKSDAEKLRVFGGDTLVVMQYAPGVTLSQWRKQFPDGKVPLDKALEITRQIASALDYAHEEKILHRDIKPANVMIETGGDGKITARVLDFGLAAEIRSSMSRVSQSVTDTSGTRPYMAPEQWLGEDQGKETDLYALAVLFNELVTGKVPFASVFDTGDPVLMMNVVGNREFNPPSELPKLIRRALIQALAKKREDRFASCLEFVDALEGGMARSKTASRSEVARGLRASSRAFIFTAVATLGLAIGGVWYWQGTHENVVVSDSLIPAKPSAKTNPPPPPPPPSGPTELDVTEIKVESSVQKERIGRIDDADGFKVRKDGLSDLYIKAVAYENAKSWSNAAINYTNYVEGCNALLALNNERNLADKNRKIAEAAKVGAEGADSAKYVSVQWNEALANAKIAGEKFAAMEFAKASHLYENAAGQFLKCELNAKKESERLKKEQEQREVALREKERLAAVAARSFALKESKRAEEEGAKQYAVDSWNRIVADWKSADDLLKEKRYAEAKNKFDEIAKAYADCIEETQRAKIARERQVLEALATNPGKVLKKDLFTPKLKKYEWIYTEILRVQGELSALLGTFTEEFSEVQEKRKEFNELLEQFVELMEKDGLGDKARKALKSWAGSEGVIKEPSFDEPSYFIYEVKSGDSLARIAQKYQITVTEIIKVNKIRPNRLWVGQKLKIPINKSVSNKSVSKVQLWEGGPYWATKNIGAEKPEDYGYYFWWGDTVGYKREGDNWVASDGSDSNFSFSLDNTPTYGKSISELESKGWIEKKNGTYVLTSKHDAAQAHWGGAWRMPTKEELDDLFSKCDWTRTTRNGKNGHVVRGKGNYASKSIFLPCAGDGRGISLNGAGSGGHVWSSVPYPGISYAYLLNYFYSGFRYTCNFGRSRGQCVRPVQGFTK